jgi:LysR family transcriptional regulator, regulator for bpeEF and oprC
VGTDLFAGVVPFLHVAEEQSFGRAAERLGVSTAAVSKAIKVLEAELGVRLFERTSRRVALTPEGTAFFERAREATQLVRSAREAALLAQRSPRGTVSISLPYVLSPLVMPVLARLAATHPALAFKLRFSDRMARLVEDEVDLALRMGELEDSSLIARLVLRSRWVTFASPEYVARHGVPRTPDELADHACLGFVMPRGSVRRWAFSKNSGAEEYFFEPRAGFEADYGVGIVDAAIAGLGIGQAPDFMVADHLRSRRIFEVLAEYSAPGPPVHALCLPGKQTTPRVKAVIQALLEPQSR